MPTYPTVALLTRKEGEVKMSFVFHDKGNVASADILSGD
jgi:outer membrane biosynthesis protein TonB